MKKTMTYEQAIVRLDEIVAELDGGKASLEQSLKLFGEGAELMAFCTAQLEKAKLTVEKLFPGSNEGGL